MMPQRSENESMFEQDDSSYGKYEGNQTFTNRSELSSEAPFPREAQAEKVYPQLYNHKNLFRLGMFMVAMVMLLVFALLFIFFLGGTGGWISFCAACLATFIVAVVAIDKIK